MLKTGGGGGIHSFPLEALYRNPLRALHNDSSRHCTKRYIGKKSFTMKIVVMSVQARLLQQMCETFDPDELGEGPAKHLKAEVKAEPVSPSIPPGQPNPAPNGSRSEARSRSA